MSRFAFPGESAFRIQSPDSNPVAFFTVVDLDIGIEFRDMRLMKGGRDGHFVKGPFRTWTPQGSAEKKHSDYIRSAYDDEAGGWNPKGQEWFAELTRVALAEYQKRTGQGRQAQARPAAPVQDSRRTASVDNGHVHGLPPDDLPF